MESMAPSAVAASFAFCDRCHISLWHRAADGPDVARLRFDVARSIGQGSGSLLVVVPQDTPLSSASARREAAEMLRALGRRLDAVAIVIEGDGFWKAAVRAMFSGIALLARPPMPWHVFSEVDSAAQWLTLHTSASKTTLCRAVRGLRDAAQNEHGDSASESQTPS